VAVNYKKCPKCGSKNSVKIVYGMPGFELFQEAEAGILKTLT
jgi:predicted nucleic-acid-binding Zn-ribbon protein